MHSSQPSNAADKDAENKKTENDNAALRKLQAEKDAVNSMYSRFNPDLLMRADGRKIPKVDDDAPMVGNTAPVIPKLNPGYYIEKEADKKTGEKFTFLIDKNNHVTLTGKPPHSGEDWRKLIQVYAGGLNTSQLRITYGSEASPQGIDLNEAKTILQQAIKEKVAITLDHPVLMARFNNPKKGDAKIIQELREMAETSQRLAAGEVVENKYVKMTPEEKAKQIEIGQQREAVSHNFHLKNLDSATNTFKDAVKAMKDLPDTATDVEKAAKLKAVAEVKEKLNTAIQNVGQQAFQKSLTGDLAQNYERTLTSALKSQQEAKSVVDDPAIKTKFGDSTDFRQVGVEIIGTTKRIQHIAEMAKLDSLQPEDRVVQKSEKINKAVEVLKQIGDAVKMSPNDAKTQDAYAQQFNHLAGMLKDVAGEIKKDQPKEQIQAYKDVIVDAIDTATQNLQDVKAKAPAVISLTQSGSDKMAYADAQVKVSNHEYLKQDVAAAEKMDSGAAKNDEIGALQGRVKGALDCIRYETGVATTADKLEQLTEERDQLKVLSDHVNEMVKDAKERMLDARQKDANEWFAVIGGELKEKHDHVVEAKKLEEEQHQLHGPAL